MFGDSLLVILRPLRIVYQIVGLRADVHAGGTAAEWVYRRQNIEGLSLLVVPGKPIRTGQRQLFA
jgi:hypothetical protein